MMHLYSIEQKNDFESTRQIFELHTRQIEFLKIVIWYIKNKAYIYFLASYIWVSSKPSKK